MENRRTKTISFRLLLFSGLFLLSPIFALVDILPDAIGFLLFVLFLAKLSDLNDELADARRLFSGLFVLSVLRELFSLIVHTAGKWENAFEAPTLLLVLSFLCGLLQALFLIPAFGHLYRGFSALSESCGIDALWATKRNLTLCERAERRTTVLVLLHSLFIVLPELGALGLRQGQTTDEGLYAFINTYRILAGIGFLILMILWWILWIGFCKVLLREKSFSERLELARDADIAAHPGRAERRSFYLSLCLLGLSMLVFLPVRTADCSIFPGTICGLLGLFGFLRLRIPKRWIAALPLILIGLVRILLHLLYLGDHLPKDALYETEAYDFYFAVRVLHGLEFLSAALLLCVLYLTLRRLFTERLSVSFETGEYAEEASRRATEKLQKSLQKKLRFGMICFSVSALFSIADLVLRPGFAYLWIPATAFGTAGLFAFWLPAFREAADDFVTLKDYRE